MAPGGIVRVRRDSRWSVPEPELVLVINAAGAVVGYTIGNDMSARDIEGENPLYLPQAKVYDGSCSIGPGVLFTADPLPATTAIRLSIVRGGQVAFEGETTTGQIKRGFDELAGWLCRESTLPRRLLPLHGHRHRAARRLHARKRRRGRDHHRRHRHAHQHRRVMPR